jgi:hypothetical protein
MRALKTMAEASAVTTPKGATMMAMGTSQAADRHRPMAAQRRSEVASMGGSELSMLRPRQRPRPRRSSGAPAGTSQA